VHYLQRRKVAHYSTNQAKKRRFARRARGGAPALLSALHATPRRIVYLGERERNADGWTDERDGGGEHEHFLVPRSKLLRETPNLTLSAIERRCIPCHCGLWRCGWPSCASISPLRRTATSEQLRDLSGGIGACTEGELALGADEFVDDGTANKRVH